MTHPIDRVTPIGEFRSRLLLIDAQLLELKKKVQLIDQKLNSQKRTPEIYFPEEIVEQVYAFVDPSSYPTIARVSRIWYCVYRSREVSLRRLNRLLNATTVFESQIKRGICPDAERDLPLITKKEENLSSSMGMFPPKLRPSIADQLPSYFLYKYANAIELIKSNREMGDRMVQVFKIAAKSNKEFYETAKDGALVAGLSVTFIAVVGLGVVGMFYLPVIPLQFVPLSAI